MKKIMRTLFLGFILLHTNKSLCGLSTGQHALRAAGSTSIGKVVLATISGAMCIAAGAGSLVFLTGSCAVQEKIEKQNQQIKRFTPVKRLIDSLTSVNSEQNIPVIKIALNEFEQSKECKEYPSGFWYGQMQEKSKELLSSGNSPSQTKTPLQESISIFKTSATTFVEKQKESQKNLRAEKSEDLKISGLWALISGICGAYCYIKKS